MPWQVDKQNQVLARLREKGAEVLKHIGPDETAVVLFGRPYNAFASEANKGVPSKFSSKGLRVIPYDMLPMVHDLDDGHNMYWSLGKLILKAAKFVAQSENLFGAYMTNFSCGPDSFLLGYFRDMMGKKPSLTLEVDSHTADAGLETRVDAFLDIVAAYRGVGSKPGVPLVTVARDISPNGVPGPSAVLPSGQRVSLRDPRVKLLVPSMGRFGTELVANALSAGGYQGQVLPPGNESTLKLGRGNTSCKECLPLQLTMGAMLDYMESRDPGEISVYVMPSAGGPCRFGQYNVFASRLLKKKGYDNAAVFAPTSLDSYGGLGEKTMAAIWRALLLGDVFEEILATLLAGARDKGQAVADMEQEFTKVAGKIDRPWKELRSTLAACAGNLSRIPLDGDYREIPKLSLLGEIYVRHDPVARQGLVERMAEAGFILRTSPIGEWMKYTDWLIMKGIEGRKNSRFVLKRLFKGYFDRAISSRMSATGMIHRHDPGVGHVLGIGRQYVSEYLTGEAVLTVGAAFHEMGNPACGILSIGPFGCMPSRVAEAVLSERFTTTELAIHSRVGKRLEKKMGADMKLPFLAMETDGQPFPQLIEARLDAFLLQASRVASLL